MDFFNAFEELSLINESDSNTDQIYIANSEKEKLKSECITAGSFTKDHPAVEGVTAVGVGDHYGADYYKTTCKYVLEPNKKLYVAETTDLRDSHFVDDHPKGAVLVATEDEAHAKGIGHMIAHFITNVRAYDPAIDTNRFSRVYAKGYICMHRWDNWYSSWPSEAILSYWFEDSANESLTEAIDEERKQKLQVICDELNRKYGYEHNDRFTNPNSPYYGMDIWHTVTAKPTEVWFRVAWPDYDKIEVNFDYRNLSDEEGIKKSKYCLGNCMSDLNKYGLEVTGNPEIEDSEKGWFSVIITLSLI